MRSESIKKIYGFRIIFIFFLNLFLFLAFIATITGPQTSRVEAKTGVTPLTTPGMGYLLRFDTTTEQFEAIALPLVGGVGRAPHSVIVLNGNIWYTDLGANLIGRLTYTSTSNYVIDEMPLPSGSGPYDITTDSNHIWFTEQYGNKIGRIDPSTFPSASSYTPFSITTPDSKPSSIDIGSDGSIWFTQKAVAQLGRLVVTTTTNFNLTELPIPEVDAQLEGLTVVNNTSGGDRVLFTDVTPRKVTDTTVLPPTTFLAHRVATYNVKQNTFTRGGELPIPSYPKNLVVVGNNPTIAELEGNQITEILVGTLNRPIANSIPTAGSQPYDLMADSTMNVWFTERIGGNLGKLPSGTDPIVEYPIPSTVSTALLQGLAIDSQDNVWIAAFVPKRLYLPTILRR